ncbi:hypothetical protein [Solicola sp. PLA-1-18]|uniref:hypothetical protein n=1 Tax=Solicola sp. PLA-1-18 TaxID=3380532 RepID=UPI003B7E66D9
MDDRRPPGFEDPDGASLWAWLFGRREAPAARVRVPAVRQAWGRPAGASPRAARPQAGPSIGWDGSVGAVRAVLTVRPDLVDPRAVWTELDTQWRSMLRAIDLERSDQPGGPPPGPVVVTVRLADRQLSQEVRRFLDGVRSNPGSEQVRAVEVQRAQPPAAPWRR